MLQITDATLMTLGLRCLGLKELVTIEVYMLAVLFVNVISL